VVQIISGFAVEGPLGGIERFGIELARALDRALFTPILCGLWRYGTPHEEQWAVRLRGEGIDAFFASHWDEAHPYLSFLDAWRGTLRYLQGQKVHLLHSHCQFGDIAALLVARPMRADAVMRTVHNEREWPRRSLRRLLLTNILYPLAFRLEAGVSRQVVDNLTRRPVARLLRRKGICLRNAIDLRRFQMSRDPAELQSLRRQLGLPLEAPIVGTVGRLTRQKGYDVLLEAVGPVLTEVPAAHFLIVGGGDLEVDLRRLAAKLGVADAVHFLGPRSDVAELLSIMDVFVSSSLWEGLPTVILESMASGVPVVATDVSGTRELVQDGDTGRLVPAKDAASLASAVVWMLREPSEAYCLRERACSRVQDFSIERVAEHHTRVYRELLGMG